MNTVHAFRMCYAQQPLLSTIVDRHSVFRAAPNSTNVIVAIICGGDNVEDSVILNKASVERGLFMSRKRRVKTVTCRHRNSTSAVIEAFEAPKDLPGKHAGANYSKIEDEDGLPKIGERMIHRDVIVGSTLTTLQYDSNSGNHVPHKSDTSFTLRHDEAPTNSYDTYVSKIVKVDNNDRQVIRIALDQLRVMRQGDKIASRHGQKGCESRHLRALLHVDQASPR